MTFRTIEQFAKDIESAQDHPRQLAKILMEIGRKMAYLSDTRLKHLTLAQNVFWQANKWNGDKPVSDKALELMWYGTEDGAEALRLDIELKSLRELKSTINTFLRLMEHEARNQM